MADDFSDITGSAGTKKSAATKEYAVTGNVLRIVLEAENWNAPGQIDRLDCGSFEIDAVDFSDPPPKVSIKAVAVPLTKDIRTQLKCKAWEKVTLKEMAAKIAEVALMSLLYSSANNPLLDRADQRQASDLEFLQRICADVGVALKVTDNQIVIFDEAEYEAKDAVFTFKRGDARITSASFSQDTSQTAESATVSYKDPKSGQLVQETFRPENPPATSRKARLNQRPVDLSGDAMRSE